MVYYVCIETENEVAEKHKRKWQLYQTLLKTRDYHDTSHYRAWQEYMRILCILVTIMFNCHKCYGGVLLRDSCVYSTCLVSLKLKPC